MVSCRDRTDEYWRTVSFLQQRQEIQSDTQPSGAYRPGPEEYRTSIPTAQPGDEWFSLFTKAAGGIDHQIWDVEQRLVSFAQLAKPTSLFNDPAAEIHAAGSEIKKELSAAEQRLIELENSISEFVNGDRATRQLQTNCQEILGTLKMKLGLCAKNLSDALRQRSQSLKQHSSRRRHFEGDTDGLRKRNVHQSWDRFAQDPDDPKGAERQAQMQEVVEQDEFYYSSHRAQAVQQAEASITELAQMYSRLVSLVTMQGETVIRIDANMDTALDNTEAGHSELVKYFSHVTSDQALIIKIFLVIIIVSVTFIIINR